MKAYSLDLRQKIFATYQAGGISQRQLAKNFGVTLSFVQDLLKGYRERGTLAPKVRTEQTPTKLNAAQLEILRQLVEEQPDATLEELRERLHEQTQVRVGVATVDRMVRLKLGLTVKKKVFTPPKKAATRYNWPALNTGSYCEILRQSNSSSWMSLALTWQ